MKAGMKMRFQQTTQAKLTLDKGDLILTSPFNRGLVEDIKALPYSARQWDATNRVWRISYAYGSDVARSVQKHLGQIIEVPKQISYSASYVQTKLFKIEYIGSVRERDDGTQTATGFANGQWSVIFPYQALKDWFGQEQKPDEAPSFYAVLGIKRKATPEEIKKAYRLAAKTWHPDVNREPDAHEQFLRIQRAYEILSDEMMRRRYDAALLFEKEANKQAKRHKEAMVEKYAWQPPLRCGWLSVEGTESLGRFTVGKILAWSEIKNNDGLIMVSYWPKGSEKFQTEWI